MGIGSHAIPLRELETKPIHRKGFFMHATKERLFPLVVAVERATGHRPHLSTVLRWASRGQNGVRLETKMLGGRRMTSTEAVDRYVAAVTAARDARPARPSLTPKQASRAADDAAAKLQRRIS